MRIKHPTIRDAFAAIVASSQDLMDIYLVGAPLDKLFSEVSCGDIGLKGASVIVPKNQYHIVIEKMKSFDTTKWNNKSALCRFLAYRCDKTFLIQFLENFPDFISKLSVGAYIYANSDIDAMTRLNEFGLLPEIDRVQFVSEIKELSVDIPDSGFLGENIRTLMSDAERSDILKYVQASLLPYLNNKIDEWRSNYDEKDDPESHFEELKSALDCYKEAFSDNDETCQKIDGAIDTINKIIEELGQEYYQDHDEDIFADTNSISQESAGARSIFDDIDT